MVGDGCRWLVMDGDGSGCCDDNTRPCNDWVQAGLCK